MKKIILLFVCFALLLPCILIGCSGGEQAADASSATDDNEQSPTEEPTEKPTDAKDDDDKEKPDNDKEEDMQGQFPAKPLYFGSQKIFSVAVSAGDSEPEIYARSELLKYFEKVSVQSRDDGYPITLSIDPSLPEDGYKREISSEGMSIVGGNGRGVLYGVYGFLEKYVGIRFLTPDLETCKEGRIELNDESYTYEPIINLRQTDWYCARFSPEWCVKNGINTCDWYGPFEEKYGGSHNYGGLFVHTLGKLTGTSDGSQPCLSDPENLKKAIASVREVLANRPDVTIVSVSQNDNSNYCRCEKCAATDAEEGSPAGTLLRFVNAVAADIAEDYPHVTVDTLAYQYTQKAPLITKPLPNVCIRLCSIRCDFTHTLEADICDENRQFCKDFNEWSKICDNIYVWDYTTNYRYYIPTYANLGVLRENMVFYVDHNVKGIFPQGNYSSPSGEFGELRAYLLAKLMMYPYMSESEYNRHMNDFLEGYYGEGWLFIRSYIDVTSTLASQGCQSIYGDPFEAISEEKYATMEELFDSMWNKAIELAGSKEDNVRRSHLQWRYIKLMLHPDEDQARKFITDVKRAGISWMEGCGTSLPDDADYSKPPHKWFKFTWWL